MRTLGKLIIVFTFTYISLAKAHNGCQYARELFAMAKISSNLQVSTDAFYLSLLACSGRVKKNEILRYSNGKIATYNFGTQGETWYYSNGQVLTYAMGVTGQTWYYPNEKTATYFSYQLDQSWYYDNGKLITRSAGNLEANQYNYEGKKVGLTSAPFAVINSENDQLDMEGYLVHLYHVKFGVSYYYRPLLPTLDL
jgi:hypothetical protein